LKALVKEQRGDGFVEVREVIEPSPGPGQVLIRVSATGICGSDLLILHDKFQGYNVPVIMGHEFAGVVEDIGSGSSSLSRGDRVVCETHAYVCSTCDFCRSGKYNLCLKRKGFGYGVDGAFAKYVSAREQIVHRLPDNIPVEDAAVIEPLSVVLNALMFNSRVRQGDTVLIIGPGPLGLLALQVVKASGAAATVAGTERSKGRLSIAGTLGAESVVTDTQLGESIQDGSLLDRFDMVVLAAGAPAAFELALKAVRRAGTVVQLGESMEKASFQFSIVARKNITIQGSFSHSWPVWERAISLVGRGIIRISPLVTHRIELVDWRNAFEVAEGRRGLKVLIRP
jgi:L-iditol 2-dehydrogenase